MATTSLASPRRLLGRRFLFEKVERPALHLFKDARDVFAENSDEGQLDPAQEGDQENDGRPARRQVPAQEITRHDEDQIKQTEQNGEQPQLRCQPDGCDGKGKRGVEGQLQHLEQRVFGFSRSAVGRFEKDKAALEADPRNHPAQEPVAFGQPPQGPMSRAGKQTKVCRAADDVCVAQKIDQPVKDGRGEPFEQS